MVITVATVILSLAHPGGATAQQPASGWQSGTVIDPKPAPAAPPSSGWTGTGNVSVVPRSLPDSGPPGQGVGEVRLSALLSDDGEPIDRGLVWRVFQPVTPGPGAALAKPRLLGTWKEASPAVRLPPGEYLVNAAFGRAHVTRKITVKAGSSGTEQFVLNAGGLRLTAVVASGEAIAANDVSFDIYAGEGDLITARSRIVSGVRPGLIVRLNAGIYQVVSTYGDANAVVRADVTVEAGKLSEATIRHQAARVTFKLVARAGGEAIADTQWTLETPQGEIIRESAGALPTHVLAAGRYVVTARNSGRVFKREFTVAAGEPVSVEVVMN